MKVYVGVKVVSKQRVYGLSVYDGKGKRLYAGVHRPRTEDEEVAKFTPQIEALLWGIKKFKMLQQNKKWSESESIQWFTASALLYSWLEAGFTVDPYRVLLADALLEFNFIPNPTEIILLESTLSRIPFNEKLRQKEEYQSVNDLV